MTHDLHLDNMPNQAFVGFLYSTVGANHTETFIYDTVYMGTLFECVPSQVSSQMLSQLSTQLEDTRYVSNTAGKIYGAPKFQFIDMLFQADSVAETKTAISYGGAVCIRDSVYECYACDMIPEPVGRSN